MTATLETAPLRLPLDERADAFWLSERWRTPGRRRLNAGYSLKPVIPRRAQIALRRAAARRQRRRAFPRWPDEDALLRGRAEALGTELAARGVDRMPVVGLWPCAHSFAYIVTHDVEGPEGLRRIPDLLEVERRYGIVSSFNFCGSWYPVADSDLELVRAAGCEVGLHGMEHDGRLFSDRATFERNLPRIAERMAAWGADGFRSPAVHRWAPWMHELPVRYDSSFPHSDPFQAQPGGCCAVHPFFFGDVVELPITLDQDFMVFELLRERTARLWLEKSRWVIRHHGLVNVLVHPDYLTDERLACYEALLGFLRVQPGGWHALPREVADWWRVRDGLRLVANAAGEPMVVGKGAERAAPAWAHVEENRIAYDY